MSIMLRIIHPQATLDHFGLLPEFVNIEDERKAVEQLDANYQHGGGWMPMKNFKMLEGNILQYPGDPPLQPLGVMELRDERIYVYQHGIVAVVQPDGSFEAARMD